MPSDVDQKATPIALAEAMDQNSIVKAEMFTCLGAGITWGGVLYKFP
ncbi:MAG: hypothetical protein KAJ62_03975 [Desulfobacteraceae bacterium]|nr:hypothetical protein [Desulfobacteraceae bacterium]